ncbi:MAG: HDOD domain-containing protein [Gemmatimonadota bacterium]
MSDIPSHTQEYGLIVLQSGKEQQSLARVLMLILNYRYGLDLIRASSFYEGFSAVQKQGSRVRCAVVIQDRKIDSKMSIASIGDGGRVPVFLVLPDYCLDQHRELCQRMENVHFCAWERALTQAEDSLPAQISRVFRDQGIGDLFSPETQSLPYAEVQRLVERRLAHLKTLPTLPQVALRIMGMIGDPDSTVEDLEEVLTADPAVVHKLLQVVSSPVFAGRGNKDGWSLPEAIVRLGRRKVGAIAQQIKLMTSLVQPEDSLFDLRRFWEHSVGCALIADRLYRDKLVRLKGTLEFNDYWIGGLLHDCGKLVLGFFFWPHFAELLGKMDAAGCTFREAEKELCDVANHEFLGRLLLLKSRVGEPLVQAVGTHHTTGRSPEPLTCLIHLANNLCKDAGKGYMPFEQSVYSAEVLETLGMNRDDVRRLQETLGESIVSEIDDLVDRCTQPPPRSPV